MKKNDKPTPNELLKTAMDENGLTQAKLAEKLGVEGLTVGRWVRGERFPRSDTRLQLRNLFKKNDEELGLIRQLYKASDVEDALVQSAPDYEPHTVSDAEDVLMQTVSDAEQEETQQTSPPPMPPTPESPLRKRNGWLILSLTGIVLLIVVGAILIPPRWPPSPDACAAAPILVDPIDGHTLTSRTVTLTWEAPRNCQPDGYTVRITANYDPEAKPWIVDTGWAPTFYNRRYAERRLDNEDRQLYH